MCGVSASITSVILCIAPCFINSRMTSTARSDMRLASSWMLMASGMTTSRTSFSFGSFEAWPFRRWVRRRNEAIERSRTSSAFSAVTSVRRPRCFCRAGLPLPPAPVPLGPEFGRGGPGGRGRTFGPGQGGAEPGRIVARRRWRRGGTGQRRLGRRRLGDDRLGRMLRLACRRVAANAALAALLDHHLFGSAVAEALFHGARLDARLERQGFCRDTEFLLARSFVDHSAVLILFTSCSQS